MPASTAADAGGKPRARGRLGARAIAVALALCLGLVAAEVALRVVHAGEEVQGIPYLHGERGFLTFPPETSFEFSSEDGTSVEVEADAFGFRNPSAVYEGDDPLVLVLGDSFVTAVNTPLEETLVERMNRGVPGYRFLNAGMNGYSNFQAYQALCFLLGNGVSPEKVILFVYLGNDLRDNYTARGSWVDYDPALTGIEAPTDATNIASSGFSLRSILRQSATARALKSVFDLAPADRFLAYFDGELELYRERPDASYLTAAREATARCLELFAGAREKWGFELYAVLVPSKAQVYGQPLLISGYGRGKRDEERALALVREGFDFGRPAAIYAELLEAESIECLDLSADFRAAVEEGTRPYCVVDKHWNAEGQALAAERVRDTFFARRSGD